MRSQYHCGEHAQAAIQRFNEMSTKQRARYRLLSGHFPYGVHEQVPGNYAYITMLRDPLNRVASFYYFIRQQADHPLNADLSVAAQHSLCAFARETRQPIMDNGQTRLLAGDWGQVPFGACNDDMLQRAKENVDQIAVVGLTEHFKESLLLLGQRFGWKDLGYRRANQGRLRPQAPKRDEQTTNALSELNHLDLELYKHANDLFSTAWSKSGLTTDDFADNHPPPSRIKDLTQRLKAKIQNKFIQ